MNKMFITSLLRQLNKEIKDKLKTGFLNKEFFSTWNFNPQSVANSRIHGLIATTLHDLGFNIEIERAFGYRKRDGKKVRFKPDITVYKGNELIAFLEYESTNSSDSRFYSQEGWSTNVLPNMAGFANDMKREGTMPPYWIIIFTLPEQPVEKKCWYSYECNKHDKEFDKITASPYKYYFQTFIKETKAVLHNKNITSKVCLMNISDGKVKLEFES